MQNVTCKYIYDFSGGRGPYYLLDLQKGSQFKSFTAIALPEFLFNYQEEVDEWNDYLKGHDFYPKTMSSQNYTCSLIQL